MPQSFRVYAGGEVHFRDARVTAPVSFAHITDVHLPPVDREGWPARYAGAIDWWDRDGEHPHAKLPRLLDAAADRNVDCVIMGGDSLDVYDARTADHIVDLCARRNLACHFAFGNHDFESYEIRYVSHQHDAEVRSANGRRLAEHWSMPNRYYSFTVGPVHFIVLDALYRPVEGGFAGFYDVQQADWLDGELGHDGPIVVVHHFPFATAVNRERLRLIWNGMCGWAAEDQTGLRVRAAVDRCPNVLGTFAGHSHVRSEDLLGRRWQFVTAAACEGGWRYVRVCDAPPPKSIRVPGRPAVEGDGGPSPLES